MPSKLGIAVTTYNRCDLVVGLCAAIRLFTTNPFDLVICDDGSSDGTVRNLKDLGEVVIGGQNGGIARNKNRGLWYLLHRVKSDIVLLLDDDVRLISKGWDLEWVDGLKKFGHLNYVLERYWKYVVEGDGTLDSPVLTGHLCGAVIGFRRDVIAGIGYFDPRFGRYGNEHTDLTIRSIRAGYGGLERPGDGLLFRCINSGVGLYDTDSHGSREDVLESGNIWRSVIGEQIYRHAWRDDAERDKFLSEVEPL